jgi:hypothetical protein
MDRDFKGVWIPKEIWLEHQLTWMEKLFLTEINSLDNADGCFAGNKYFSEFFKLSPHRCSEIINQLVQKEYLAAVYERKGCQIVRRILRVSHIGIREMSRTHSGNVTTPIDISVKDNNILINNTNNKNKEKITENPLYKWLIDLFYKEYQILYNQKLVITGKEGSQVKELIKKSGQSKEILQSKFEILLQKIKNQTNVYYKLTPGDMLSKWNDLVPDRQTRSIDERIREARAL